MDKLKNLKIYLEKDYDQNISPIMMYDYEFTDIHLFGDEGAIFTIPDDFFCKVVSYRTTEALKKISPFLQDGDFAYFANFSPDDMTEANIKFLKCNECHQFVCKSTLPSEITLPKDFVISPLTTDLANEVYENYTMKAHTSPEEIAEDIVNRPALGAFHEGKLVGYIFTHPEYAIGGLEIYPQYRRLGLGELLAKSLSNELLKMGKVPYGHVILGNEKSLALQKKLGNVETRAHIAFSTIKR